VALVLFLAASQTASAASLGSGSSFNELTKSEPETTATQTVSQASTTSTNNPSSLLFIGAAVAIVLLGGIAMVIVRDARRVAPVADGQVLEGRPRSDSAARLRRRRARAKAARQQRKRNR
jgi:hypothetical protein